MQKETKIALIFGSFVFTIIWIIRCYYTFLTGFMVPDEAVYYYNVWNYFGTGKYEINYPARVLYQIIIFCISILFRLDNVYKYIFIISGISTLCSIFSLFLIYKILKKFGYDDKYVLYFVIFSPIFVIMSPFALTESISLFFILLGIFFMIKSEDNMIYVFPSAVFTVFSYLVRETYMLYYIGIMTYMIWKFSNRISILIYFSLTYFMEKFINWTYLFIVVRDSNFIIYPSDEFYFSNLSNIFEVVIAFVRSFTIGHLLGFGLIFIFVIYFSLNELYKRNFNFILVFSIVAIMTSSIALLYQSRYNFYQSSLATTDMIRQTYPSILGIFILAGKLNRKYLIAVLFSFLIFGSGILLFQSSISLNTLNFDYRSPCLKVANYVNSKDGIIVGEPILRLREFVERSIVVRLPTNNLEELYNTTGRIYLYGEKHINHVPAISYHYPNYYSLLQDKTKYKIIWDDNDSYFYELIK